MVLKGDSAEGTRPMKHVYVSKCIETTCRKYIRISLLTNSMYSSLLFFTATKIIYPWFLFFVLTGNMFIFYII